MILKDIAERIAWTSVQYQEWQAVTYPLKHFFQRVYQPNKNEDVTERGQEQSHAHWLIRKINKTL